MEPTAQGRTEKSFSYVIRAPSSDGSDVMNVDVKIDTCWIFRDVEENGEEQGCLPEGAASSPDVDMRMLRKQLESSEQKLLAAVDKYVASESGLRSRIQELELAERRLLRRVDQLGARVVQERSASLRVQEQLRALQGELAGRVRAEERRARRQRRRLQRLRGRLRRKDQALERCGQMQRRQMRLVRQQERVLRAQVRGLERDVRRLCLAAGQLLAQRDTAAPVPSPAGPPDAPAAELRAQLEELSLGVYGLQLSEIGLRCRVEELAGQNRSLRAELRARAPAAGRSLDALGRVQEDALALPREQKPGLCRSHGRPHDAPGPPAAAGRLSEGPCTRVPIGAGPGPCVAGPELASVGETPGDLEDFSETDPEQRTPAELGLDGRILLLVCGCPPGQCLDQSLLPPGLAWSSEGPTTAGAQEPLLPVQTPTLPLWGAAGDPEPLLSLLLREAPPEESGSREVLDSRPPHALGTTVHPQWPGCTAGSQAVSSHHGSPCASRDQGQWTPEEGGEEGEARRTLSRMEAELGDKWQPGQGSLGRRVCSSDDLQDERESLEPQATVSGPEPECPVSLLRGEAPVLQGAPGSLSSRAPVDGFGWNPPGGTSALRQEAAAPATRSGARGTREPGPPGGQLPAGKGRASRRAARGAEDSPLRPQQASPGDREQEEEKVLCQETPSPGHRDVPKAPGSQMHQDKDTLSSAGEGALRQFPGAAVAAIGDEAAGPPWTLNEGGPSYALQMDGFERDVEACFQQLASLKASSGGPGRKKSRFGGENWSFAQRRYAGGAEVSASQASKVCPTEAEPQDAREGVGLGKTLAPFGTCETLPGTAPDGDSASQDPAGLSLPWGALERARARFHLLLSALKEERSQVLQENATLQDDLARCRRYTCDLEKERGREASRRSGLEQASRAMEAELAALRGERAQYRQVISDLEDCNGKSYRKISELEEENADLKRSLGRLRKAMAESARKARGGRERSAPENAELKAQIAELGVSYRELIKDRLLGIEGMIRALKREDTLLLHRALQQEEALRTSWAVGRGGGQREPPQGIARAVAGKVCTVDTEVQGTRLSGQLTTRACGPPWEEEVGVPAGPVETSVPSGESPDGPWLAWRSAEIPGARQKGMDGAGGTEARLGKEDRRCVDPGQAGRCRSDSQLQDKEAKAPEEDPRLCVQRLHHRVRTLQCQLRDQASAHRGLQMAHDEAVRLQDELKGKLAELQKQHHEERLAVTPLKAKLCSLVFKSRERNRLITSCCRNGTGLAPRTTRSAGWRGAASFLTPGLPETNHSLDIGSQGTAVGRAQGCLPDLQLDGKIQSPLGSGPRPAPGAGWPAPTSPLHSPEVSGEQGAT